MPAATPAEEALFRVLVLVSLWGYGKSKAKQQLTSVAGGCLYWC